MERNGEEQPRNIHRTGPRPLARARRPEHLPVFSDSAFSEPPDDAQTPDLVSPEPSPLMPVFTRFRDGVLVVTVDGDYTAGELRRAATRGLDADDVTTSVPMLVDMSGAAGLAKTSAEALGAAGDFFAEERERLTRVAILTVSEAAFEVMSPDGDFVRSAGLETRPFRDRAEALAWLAGDGPAEPTTG